MQNDRLPKQREKRSWKTLKMKTAKMLEQNLIHEVRKRR
jgi:hypothetical protein